MRTKLSILLPVYNEKDNVRPLIAELETVMGQLGRSYEIIAVDDGSNDGTTKELLALAQQKNFLKVVVFRKNSGQTAALDAGFQHASGDIIITMDADGQNDPADIPEMLKLLEQGYDFVSGWRKQRRDGFWLRTFPSRIANWLIRRVMRTKLNDLGCSLKVYRREITQELKLYGEMHRLVGVFVEGMGAKVAEYEVHHRPRIRGVSKYNLTRVYKVLLDVSTAWFLQGFGTKPIYLFGGLGSVLIGLSTVLCGNVLWTKLMYDDKVHRNPLFTVAVFLCVIGVQFIVLGLLAELIIRIYFESRRQRPYSISLKYGFSTPDSESRSIHAA